MRLKFSKLLMVFIYLLFVIFGTVKAIPNEYISNYNINTNRSGILEILTKIEAYRKTGKSIPTTVFSTLYNNFRSVWKYLPQDPSYKVVYEQCDITTSDLSKSFNYNGFSSFLDQCYEPIIKITNEINSKYTIIPAVTVSPDNWPAPLNVTFDWRWSKDPSNDTIPSDNFFWYYKDTQWITRVIWKWPVLNHTFADAGNYVVHSTIRSVNIDKWIQDWSTTINVNVSPKSANIAIYANGKKMSENYYVKLWTTEWKNGVTFDWSATTANWGRKIINHTWTLTSVDWYKNEITSEWSPSVIKFALPGNGIYTVKLSLNDNENNNISQSYKLVISDPVAIIKQSPENWTTSTNFSFDAGNSYSIDSKIKMYKREIFDTNNNLVDTIQSKQITKKFIKPWSYTIKLTIYDDFGKNNIEQNKLIVESTDPIAQYTFIPTQSRQSPSQYILDASNSFDIDMVNNYDNLTYERKTSSNNAKIEQSFDNNKRILLSFNEKWTYKITLSIKDSYWKISEITKEFVINSTVRPIIISDPWATTRGKSIKLTTKTNKPIVSYRRDFGDNTSKSTTDSSTFHEFKSAWIYLVKLQVTTNNLEENSIQIPIFIWDINKPIWVYDIINSYQQSLVGDKICTTKDWDKPSYQVDRYEQIEINTSKSLNTKWQTNWLNTYFKPQNDSIFKWANLKYRFSEVWCQYMDIIVEDQNESTMDKKRIYFKVKNALPTLNNIIISFPQYSNEVWVWFMQNKLQDPNFNQFDPLAVRVVADNPIDKDWQISFFTRYYYKTDDPNRLLDIKITPGNINGAIFNVSREAWEYTFGVKMTDNDWWERTSEEIIGKWPVVFVQPKWSDSNNIPIVTLKTNSTLAKIWEVIKFTTTSKILSDKSDFKSNRIFKYDFDWDGTFDLTTKDDVVNYAYSKASSDWWFKPKVKIIYKDKVWEAVWDTISVKKWLKSSFDYITNDKSIYIYDTSIWTNDSTKLEYCMDIKNCKSSDYIIKLQDWKKFFKFDYPDYGRHLIKLTASDDFGNEENYKQIIEITKSENTKYIDIISFPKIQKTEDWENIKIWKILDNTVRLYIQNNNISGACDISAIIWSQTKDYKCNELNNIQFDENQEIWYINIKYDNDKWTVNRQIKVILIDNQYVVPDKYISSAKQIDNIRKEIAGKSEYSWFDSQLSTLRKSLGDRTAMNDIIPTIKQNIDIMSGNDKKINFISVNKLLEWLSDKSTKAIMWATDYDQAKSDILSLISDPIKDQVSTNFEKINNANWNKDEIRNQMTWILSLVKDEVGKNNMDSTDFDIIKSQICQIAKYKEIPTDSCNNIELKNISTWTIIPKPINTNIAANNSSNSIVKTIIKVMLWIIWLVVVLFLGWVIYYAIKKRKEQNEASIANPPASS